ncbi:TPA: hypothetical protein HA278_03390 [Candidatus Woesearchaeota archaeon]|nr:hypothetical protein [Candidatus Woesearchaeota archaeon]|tara:strand:- start:172 stop:540 length:369 start_codon:yes stop_codon:yes gene_type:complete
MGQLQELEETFLEEYEAACILQKHQKTKSVTILLSKALFALVDYLIFAKYQKLPKNHSERFRILEIKEPLLYTALDDVWGLYRDSYSKPALEETVTTFMDTIHRIIQENEHFSQKITEISTR